MDTSQPERKHRGKIHLNNAERGTNKDHNTDSQKAVLMGDNQLPAAATQSAIRFVAHPHSTYILKARPAELSCRALNAGHLRFQCNSRWLPLSQHTISSGLSSSPSAGTPFVEAHVEITRSEFESSITQSSPSLQSPASSTAAVQLSCQCYAAPPAAAKYQQRLSAKSGENSVINPFVAEEEGKSTEEVGDSGNPNDNPDELFAQEVGGVPSEVAIVRLAYIRKHFYQTPPSMERVHEGLSVQLPCVPPDADPQAEVVWWKDGGRIRSSLSSSSSAASSSSSSATSSKNQGDESSGDTDSNLIVGNDGSLIISAARLTDSGNYTCEARNPANSRWSDPTQLLVYVDGQWSPWSEWHGNCNQQAPIDCTLLKNHLLMTRGSPSAVNRLLPQQRRARTCNNPPPLNGGANCPPLEGGSLTSGSGEEEEFRTCKHACRIDGEWSAWSAWSECDPQTCQRIRSRRCDAPAPANGGAFCLQKEGENEAEWKSCFVGGGGNSSASASVSAIPSNCLPPSLRIQGGGGGGGRHESIFTQEEGKASKGHRSAHSYNSLTRTPNGIGGSSVDLLAPDSPQGIFVLGTIGCVAFLLLVIALLGAALLYSTRRKGGGRIGGGGGGGKKKRKGFSVGGCCSPSLFPSLAADCSSTMLAAAATSSSEARIFVDENGDEKLYFPLPTNEGELEQVRNLLLTANSHSTCNSPQPPKLLGSTTARGGSAGSYQHLLLTNATNPVNNLPASPWAVSATVANNNGGTRSSTPTAGAKTAVAMGNGNSAALQKFLTLHRGSSAVDAAAGGGGTLIYQPLRRPLGLVGGVRSVGPTPVKGGGAAGGIGAIHIPSMPRPLQAVIGGGGGSFGNIPQHPHYPHHILNGTAAAAAAGQGYHQLHSSNFHRPVENGGRRETGSEGSSADSSSSTNATAESTRMMMLDGRVGRSFGSDPGRNRVLHQINGDRSRPPPSHPPPKAPRAAAARFPATARRTPSSSPPTDGAYEGECEEEGETTTSGYDPTAASGGVNCYGGEDNDYATLYEYISSGHGDHDYYSPPQTSSRQHRHRPHDTSAAGPTVVRKGIEGAGDDEETGYGGYGEESHESLVTALPEGRFALSTSSSNNSADGRHMPGAPSSILNGGEAAALPPPPTPVRLSNAAATITSNSGGVPHAPLLQPMRTTTVADNNANSVADNKGRADSALVTFALFPTGDEVGTAVSQCFRVARVIEGGAMKGKFPNPTRLSVGLSIAEGTFSATAAATNDSPSVTHSNHSITLHVAVSEPSSSALLIGGEEFHLLSNIVTLAPAPSTTIQQFQRNNHNMPASSCHSHDQSAASNQPQQQMQHPMVISVAHWGEPLTTGQSFGVARCEPGSAEENGTPAKWEIICRLGAEDLNTPVHLLFAEGQGAGGLAHLMVGDYGSYVLVGYSADQRVPPKSGHTSNTKKSKMVSTPAYSRAGSRDEFGSNTHWLAFADNGDGSCEAALLSPEISAALAQLLDSTKSIQQQQLHYTPRSAAAAQAGWLQLARRLFPHDTYYQYFATQPGCSPTQLVLELWEARVWTNHGELLEEEGLRKRKLAALEELAKCFRELGRVDAANILEDNRS